MMTKAAKKAKNSYMKEWRKNNPEKIKKYQINFWERQAQKMAEENEKGAISDAE